MGKQFDIELKNLTASLKNLKVKIIGGDEDKYRLEDLLTMIDFTIVLPAGTWEVVLRATEAIDDERNLSLYVFGKSDSVGPLNLLNADRCRGPQPHNYKYSVSQLFLSIGAVLSHKDRRRKIVAVVWEKIFE